MKLQKLLKNQEKAAKKEGDAQSARLLPLAELALQLLGDKPPMGNITNTQPPEYKDLALKMQQAMLDANINWIERKQVFKLAFQALEFLQDTTIDHMEKSFEHASEKLWGANLIDIKMKDIDEVLKN